MFSVEDHGTIVLIRPLTDDVTAWLLEHVAHDDEQDVPQWFGSALVVEPRYVAPLVDALEQEGWVAQ